MKRILLFSLLLVFLAACQEVVPEPTRPAAPTNLQATGEPGQIALTWGISPSPGVAQYRVYRSIAQNVQVTEANRIADNVQATNYLDEDVTPGTEYFYVVTAVDAGGTESVASNEARATAQEEPDDPPTPPATLTATPGLEQVTLEWAASAGAQSYNIYRSETSPVDVDAAPIDTVDAPQTNYTDTNVTPGTQYFYVVTAENEFGESDPSPEASAIPEGPPVTEPPAPPATLSAVGGLEQVTLNWAASAGAESYNIYRSETAGVVVGDDTLIDTVAAPQTSYTDTEVTTGTAYFYVVTAENEFGESGPSPEASATPFLPGPALVELDFTEAVADTLQDAQGLGTGFNLVQGGADIVVDGVPLYNPQNLTLNTGAGTLTITAEQGIQFQALNNLQNGLGYALGAQDEALSISTEMVKPTFIGNNFQQGGVWFGLAQDQDNYVKLVVIQDGGPLVEMLVEEGGQAPVATNRVRTEVLPIDDGMDVELVLNVGTDGTVSGSYAIDGGPLTALPGTLSVPQGWLASNDLAAGIMATRRNQTQDLLFTFNAFAIQPGSDEPPTNGPTTFQVELSGEQEAPDPVETDASGSATVTLDGNTLTIEGSFEGLESDLISVAGSPAHVHEAPPGQNGPIVFNLDVSSDDNRSGTLSATQELSEAQLEVFNAGNYYINIHTEDNPGGELRGQLVP